MRESLDFSQKHKEGDYEKSLRPKNLQEYIGQEKICKNLEVFISASRKRAEPLDHTLLFGSPGLGKTTLAFIISHEMESNLKITSAPMIEKSGDLAALLTNLSENDILFIDEIHRLSPAIEEILYSAMEDFRLDIIIGSGPSAQTVQIDLPPFTLIGATTRAGMLSTPLRERFGIHFRMEFYTETELSEIIEIASRKMDKQISPISAHQIAKRSRGTPRIALRLLRRVRDFSDYADEVEITLERTGEALESLGINEYGFDSMDIQILERLLEAKGKAVGLKTLSAILNEDIGTIEEVIEPYLITNGYIEKTARGRVATRKTYEVLKFNE
ncbi:Holliday junction DNA helicase, RuvB subunit [Thiovulum sp. ES]|nr:Holliday junction DNA helicase, RuvB subunit [Thiovulum sp. ES]